jgi:programmed cell death protein 5
MDGEDEIKKALIQKKLQESQQKQAEEGLKNIISKILDKKARERLSNLKLVKPELAMQLEIYLVQLYQAGHIRTITEDQLIEILKKLSEKKEFRIKRK